MTKTSEFRTKPSEPSSSAAAKAVFLPASHTEVPLNCGGFSVTAALEPDLKPAWDARCLWCGRDFHAAFDRWIGSEVLLRGAQTTVLDRGAALDDAGDRGGPTLGRLLEGVSARACTLPEGHFAPRESPQGLTLTC